MPCKEKKPGKNRTKINDRCLKCNILLFEGSRRAGNRPKKAHLDD